MLFDLREIRRTGADIPEKLGLSMHRKHRIRHNAEAKIFAVSKSKKNAGRRQRDYRLTGRNAQSEMVWESSGVEIRTGEEKLERRTLPPKFR